MSESYRSLLLGLQHLQERQALISKHYDNLIKLGIKPNSLIEALGSDEESEMLETEDGYLLMVVIDRQNGDFPQISIKLVMTVDKKTDPKGNTWIVAKKHPNYENGTSIFGRITDIGSIGNQFEEESIEFFLQREPPSINQCNENYGIIPGKMRQIQRAKLMDEEIIPMGQEKFFDQQISYAEDYRLRITQFFTT